MAITACAYVVSPVQAILVGALGGLVHNGVFALLLRLKLDDPVGAVPVHLGGGVLGTLAVGFLGRLDILSQVTGHPHSRLGQIGVQAAGVAVVGAWTVTMSYLLLRLLRATVGLRASPQEEMEGLNLAGEPIAEAATVGPSEALDRTEIERLLR
ncbi:MAG: hypothetical protein U0166_00360 [Acidobacteriota bacterium]